MARSAYWSRFLKAAIPCQNPSKRRLYLSIPIKYANTGLIIILNEVADDMHHGTLPTATVSDEAVGNLQSQSPSIITRPIEMATEAIGGIPTMDVVRDAGEKRLPAVTIREKGAGDAQQGDQSISADNEDAWSRTSTEYHEGHEPWETFQHKVAQLCRTLWPKHSEEQIIIERMRGGEYNRVIGVCVTGRGIQDALETGADEAETPDLPPGNYVLRITRSDEPTTSREIATLRFVKKRVSLPLPTVVHSDGPDNPLGFAYVLQVRAPGHRLDKMWSTLNHTQRLLVALDIARVCAEIMSITNPSCGIPEVERGQMEDGSLTTIGRYFPGDDDEKTTINPQPPLDYLCDRLDRWGEEYGDVSDAWANAKYIVQHMQATNRTFEPDPSGLSYYLTHGDLYPRNIMVQAPTENTAFVTCILDWDEANFAPGVVALAPPAWLWMEGWWKSYSEEGCLSSEDFWITAHDTPDDKEASEIKTLFDSIVGPEYLQNAYSPDAHSARKIWNAAHESCGSSWVADDLEQMYEAWKARQTEISTASCT